jgi:hypothetical protein
MEVDGFEYSDWFVDHPPLPGSRSPSLDPSVGMHVHTQPLVSPPSSQGHKGSEDPEGQEMDRLDGLDFSNFSVWQ